MQWKIYPFTKVEVKWTSTKAPTALTQYLQRTGVLL